MVVVVEPDGLQAHDLVLRQHAQRHAGFQPQGFHGRHHFRHATDIAILGAAPGRPHAESGRAGTARPLCSGDDLLQLEQPSSLDAGVVTHALRTIGAVFGTTACLDAEQSA